MRAYAVCLAAAAGASAAGPGLTVNTTAGPVVGQYHVMPDGVEVQLWKGVPYAAPPVGDRRWRAPVAPERWTEPRAATTWPPSCVNALFPPDAAVLCRTCSTRNNAPTSPNSEDCLYVNVVSPVGAARAPVMVFVHGGAGFMGSAPIYTNTSAFASRGAVLVTIQYRLGALGWMPTSEGGNWAVRDKVAALQWVRDNIAGFGGDPSRVTVFGQSYGGSAMHYLLLTPLAKGLFTRVIVESGGVDWSFPTYSEALPNGRQLLSALGCANLTCARQATWASVMDAPDDLGQMVVPFVDGDVFLASPGTALREGQVNRVPVIFGCNAEEPHLGAYFAGRTYADASGDVSTASELRTAVEQTLLKKAKPARNATAAAAAAAALLNGPYTAARGDMYTRAGAVASDSNAGLAAFAWAHAWSQHAEALLYVFTGSATGSPPLEPFGATHLLEVPLVFGDTYIMDRQGHPFDEAEARAATFFGDAWVRFASGLPPSDAWAPYNSSAPGVAMVIGNGGEGPGTAMREWSGGSVLGFFAEWEGLQV